MDSGKEEEAFEIQDFTLASDWEKFIYDIELILRKWSVVPSMRVTLVNVNESPLIIQQEIVTLDSLKSSFVLTYFQYNDKSAKNESIFTEREWEQNWYESLSPIYLQSHSISINQLSLFKFIYWFGFKKFILLQPRANSFASTSLTQSHSHLLLSSIQIALSNCQRNEVPIFIPVRDQWRDEYIGFCHLQHQYNFGYEVEEATIYFHSEIIFSAPYSLPDRKALVLLFFEKLGVDCSKGNKFSLINRFSYVRRSNENEVSLLSSEEPLSSLSQDNPDDPKFLFELNNIFFGSPTDPIEHIRLISAWKQEGNTKELDKVNDEVLVVVNAPCWSIEIKKEVQLQLYLTYTIKSFLSCHQERVNYDSIDSAASNLREGGKNLPFFTAVSFGLKLLKSPRFPSGKEIDTILGDIFNFPSANFILRPIDCNLLTDPYFAPSHSLLSLLVSFMFNLEGLPAVCKLWKEFVKEVRWHWEQRPPLQLPFIELPKTSIDMRRCLIYQKLQMLNYCSTKFTEYLQQTHKKAVERTSSEESLHSIRPSIPSDGWDNDIEFVIDASPSPSPSTSTNTTNTSTTTTTTTTTTSDRINRLGAKAKLQPPLTLLQYYHIPDHLLTDDHFIFIPDTQTTGIITEDMIDTHDDDDDDCPSPPNFNLHHAQLQSDMEAFKAANPGSCMGDFVRWYSPTDWIDSPEAEAREKDTISNLGAEEKKNEEESELDSSKYSSIGRLSLRMRAPGNIWCKFWNESLPTPVYDQKPLFNFTKEAEKALHYLETISPSDLINQLIGVAMKEAVDVIACSQAIHINCVQQMVTDTASEIYRKLGHSKFNDSDIESLVLLVANAEKVATQALSLIAKFGNQYELINNLLSYGQMVATTESARQGIQDFFCNNESSFGPVEEEEYLIQTRVQTPGSPIGSPPVLQRLFARITGNDFRLATAFVTIN